MQAVSNPFERPIVNSPYAYPRQHWELDESGLARRLERLKGRSVDPASELLDDVKD